MNSQTSTYGPATPVIPGPAQAPFHIMVKPIGPICNIGCKYCFYLEKENLFETGEKWKMSEAMLERYVRSYIESQPSQGQPIVFAWQGGEPTLMGLDFFKKAVQLQKKYGQGREIENAFQTNATLINREWASFFKDNNFLVGVSIDGPQKIHDHYRVTKTDQPTWESVMRGIEHLQKAEAQFNTLTCVNRVSSQKPGEVYRFLKGIGSKYLQFIPIVERRPNTAARKLGLDLSAPPPPQSPPIEEEDDPRIMPWAVKSKDYGNFLVSIFDRWVRHDIGRIYVQLFDVALGKWLNIPGGLCIFAETCGSALAMEHNGDLYSCDHYVYPDYKLGNIANQAMPDLVESAQQQKFGTDKRDTLPGQCIKCSYRFACNGGCPKHRFIETPDGEDGLNYLCEGYYHFFEHVHPYMRVMAQLYQNRQPPAAIMDLIRQGKIPGIRK